MLENLERVKKKYEDITNRLSDPEVLSDQTAYRKLTKEHAKLSPLVAAYEAYVKVRQELEDHQRILDDPAEDPDIKVLAGEEAPGLSQELERLNEELKTLLLPKDPLDDNNIVLEIRAGTGGDEAALFVGDLLKMYLRFAELRKWRTEVLSSSSSEMGGFKEIIVGMEGGEVYRTLKFESGVHRVQRVPQTESQGRVHTSTATVAVMPEADDVEVEINSSDLRIDVFRSSGPGGQSVNTTDSAVRITHLPTGVVAQSQDEKSQHKNKAKAMKVLSARIYEQARLEQTRQQAEQRRTMVGTGDRSERIRTYNFPQGRITDHRIGLTLYKLNQVLQGELDELVDALLDRERTELLQQSEQGAGAATP
ncbi:MAG: peptide chain release factor 1 [SAR324 cluster bacterium]|nr:peptide chain release factor 1 [SAR324 cluster bacterium]MCZ6729358.1 peptide chain release factor 1 [SAR324 cluster bacterium]MCZ6842091.1 peptide chain release factor 1 [SAR324 cluster bacterium]